MLQKGKFYPVLNLCNLLDRPYDGIKNVSGMRLSSLSPDDIVLFVETRHVPWMEGRFGSDRIQAWHKVVFGDVIGWMAGELGAMIDAGAR